MKKTICTVLAALFLLTSFLNATPIRAETDPAFNSEAALDGGIVKWGRPYPPVTNPIAWTSYTYIAVGQAGEPDTTEPGNIYYIWRGYLSFDTSSVPDDADITTAKLKLKTRSNYTPVYDFNVEVRGDQQPIYGNSLEVNDWGCGTTIVGTWNTVNYQGNGIYIEISIPSGQVNKAGRTQFELRTDREGISPGRTDEYVTFYSGDSAGNEPILEVTWTMPPVPRFWALIVGGSTGQSFSNNAQYIYHVLDTHYDFDDIYYLDVDTGLPGVDALSTRNNVRSAITNWLHTRSGARDIVFIYFTSHGEGYFPRYSSEFLGMPFDHVLPYCMIGRYDASGDEGNEVQESTFRKDCWVLHALYDIRGDGVPPWDWVRNFDADAFIEIDLDTDGTIDIQLDALEDLDGDGWADDIFLDPDRDDQCDIAIDADVNHDGVIDNFVSDGEDIDNDGWIVGLDLNGNGNFNDWVGVDESIQVQDGWYWDDELANDLGTLSCAKLIFVRQGCIEGAESCFGGGLIDDISAPNRIIMSATNETTYSIGDSDDDGFSEWSEAFIDALHGEDTHYDNGIAHEGTPINADTNGDGHVSMREAWNYAWNHDDARLSGLETPWLDDDGNGLPTYINGADQLDPDDGNLAANTWLLISHSDAGSGGDAGDNFNTATLVNPGSYTGYADHMNDYYDWYRFNVPYTYWAISVTMYPPSNQNFDLYLYNPNGDLKASSTKGGDASESIWFSADSTGEWRMLVGATYATGSGTYSFTLSVTSGGGGSCPFIYSWDGQYHFEHEAYPFAVMKSVETTSYDRLKYLRNVDGEYRLKIEQVLNEKDWTDSFELYVVDHPDEDSFVMPDLQGNLHTLKELIQPISAYEKNGDDCLADVKYLDDKTWKDSIYDADVDDESTLRNWIVLTFPKPGGVEEAKLLLSVKKQTTITKAWEFFINLIGENYWDLWQEIMENPTLTKLGMEMMEREINLKIEVWNGMEWIRQDSLAAGDSLWDDFLAVLNISDVEGDELQVRLYFTTANYEINYVGIDYSEDEPMIVHKVDPYYAVKNGEEDVLAALEKTDENYVTLMPNDVIELRYEAIPESEWNRDFTIATKGYYNFVDFQDQTVSGFHKGIVMWLKAMREPYFVAKTVLSFLQESQ